MRTVDFYGTLGPGCAKNHILTSMFQQGMTGLRLNLSHGMLKDNANIIYLARNAASRAGCDTKLLIDLQGPELRVGDFSGIRKLRTDSCVILGMRGIPVPSPVLTAARPGMVLLMDDGKIKLKVVSQGSGQLVCHVERGGDLAPRKSITMPEGSVRLPVLTQADMRNLSDASSYGVTGVMLPFVRSREDVLELRKTLRQKGVGHIRVLAKIENREGMERLADFIQDVDEVVIARGDLGNAMPLWELPAAQDRIAKTCRMAGVPFMVVTQMLDSMEHRPVPTRAEVSDIYRAVADGASSLMLTGETAAGEYPVESMAYLVKTANASWEYLKRNC